MTWRRGARRPIKFRPVEVEGFRLASESEAIRFRGLRAMRPLMVATPSADGVLLVCEWQSKQGTLHRETFILAARKPSKFNAKETPVDGRTFDSEWEARVYLDLKKREQVGEIQDLQCQVTFQLVVSNVKVSHYTADFVFTVCATGEVVTVDAKSTPTRTEAYVIRRKLMRAIHSIVITEVTNHARSREKAPPPMYLTSSAPTTTAARRIR